MPHTMRSGLVGISLRWRLRSFPSGPMTTTVLNSVVPLNALSSSWMPITIVTPCRAAASWSGCKSPRARSTAFSRSRAWSSPDSAMSPPGRSRQIQVG